MIKKLIATVAVAATIATASVGISTEAEAHNVGLGIAAGIIGGIAVGSIIASQRPAYYYDDGYYYRPAPRCHRVLYENEYGERYWRRVCR